MFGVFESGKPCSTAGFPYIKGKVWSNHLFATFEESHAYAQRWLGDMYAKPLALNEEYEFSGYGDTICIREVS